MMANIIKYEIGMARRAGSIKKAIQGFWRRQIVGPKTTRWQWSILAPDALYEPRLLFLNTPPVSVSGVESRVLICCTRVQRATIGDNPPIACGSRVTFSTRVGLFWEAFFDDWYFCDRPVTVPRLLAATGQMRNYSYLGGETLDVGKALEGIAVKFGVAFVRLRGLESLSET